TFEIDMLSRFRWWLRDSSPKTQIFIAVVAAGLLSLGLYRIWASVSSNQKVRDAEVALDDRDYLRAKSLLEAAIIERPDSGQLHFLASRAARRQGDFKEARQLLKRSEELGWAEEAIKFERLLLDAQTIDFQRAEPVLVKYESADPPNPDAELVADVLILGYLQQYELGTALRLLEKWSGRRPRDIKLRLWTHEIGYRLNARDMARRALVEALEINPEHEEARAKLAELLNDMHRAAEAKPHFEKLLQFQPKNRNYRFGLAKSLREMSDFEGARKILDTLLAEDNTNYFAMRDRAFIDLFTGKPQDALPRLEEAHRQNPYEIDVLMNYALCLEQMGRSAEAKAIREKQVVAEREIKELEDTTYRISREPANADLRFRAAEILVKNGQEIEARRWLESNFRVDPNHEPTKKLYSQILLKKLTTPPTVSGQSPASKPSP
ncbi:MAG: tetratricopeptide repeat protein, partial [Gemmataceae bacterium]